MIVGFSQASHPAAHGQCGSLRPEYRTEAFERGDGQAVPEFDMFQLGFLPWPLYRDQDQQGVGTSARLDDAMTASLRLR